MTLRMLLVGTVASLGLELPTGQDLGCWVERGQAWCRSGAETCGGWWSSLGVEAEEAPATACEAGAAGEADALFRAVVEEVAASCEAPEPAADDAGFAAVVDAMAAGFAAETEAVTAEVDSTEVVREDSSPSFEPVELGDDPYPGLAYALNREADGLAGPAAAEASGPGRGERLSTAVHLTTQALHAWLSVLHDGPSGSLARR